MLNSTFYQPVHNASRFPQKKRKTQKPKPTQQLITLTGNCFFGIWSVLFSLSSLGISYDGRNLFALRWKVIKFIECRVVALVNTIS